MSFPYLASQDSASFIPTSIQNCVLWLDAADRSTLVLSGSSVTTWTDKASSIPFGPRNGSGVTYSNSLVNLASNSFLKNNSGSITIGQTYTIFMIASNTTGTQGAAAYISPLGGGSPGIYIEWPTPTNYRYTYRFPASQGGGTTVLIAAPGVLPLTLGTFFRITSGANYNLGMGINATLNPTLVLDTTSGPLGSCTQIAFGTNYQNDGTTDRPLTGSFAEILVYNAILSTAEQQQVQAYLCWKWGLQTNLPFENPYKNQALVTFNNPNAFYPNYIAGNTLWLDAADSSTVTGTNPVTNWTDKSGNGRTVTFTGTSTYNSTTRSVNTTSTSLFGANVDSRKTTVPNLNVFIVYRWQGSTLNTNQGLWGQDVGGGWNRFQLLTYPSDTSIQYGLSFTASGPPFTTNVTGMNNSNRLLYHAVYSSTASSTGVYINGTAASSFVTEGAASPQTSSTSTFFATINGSTIQATVDFHEIIMYSTSITTAQRQVIEGYLAWKWGLEGSLPATHPYKNNPVYFYSPTVTNLSLSIPYPITSVAFNPRSIAGLRYWFDSSDSTNFQLTGTSMVTWFNKGTFSGSNMTVNTGTATFGSATQAGFPLLSLPAGCRLQFSGNFASGVDSSTPRARFFATRPTVTTNTTNTIGWLFEGGSSVSGYDYVALAGSNGIYEIAQGQIVNLQSSNIASQSNVFGIYTICNTWSSLNTGTSNNTNNRIALTGSNIPLTINIPANQYNTATVTTYVNWDTTSAQQLGEWLSYSADLGAAEVAAVEGYLAWKWGVQTNLPLNHPFRLYPPPPRIEPPSSGPPPFAGWSNVLNGSDASVTGGSGTFTCTGPNDGGGDGWAYIYGFFATAGSITYNFSWFTSDGIVYDWPFEFVTSSDPANPVNVNFNTKIASTNSQSGSRTVSYGANQYVVLGVYSIDSVFGNGVCTFSGLPT